jgi:transposase
MVEQGLGLNPFGSALYVFINRQRTKIKVLYWHRNGFCLWQKRLESERFAWVPKLDQSDAQSDTQAVSMREFEWLLEGFDLWKNKPHKTLEFASVS